MLVSDSAPRQAKLLGTDEGLMFPDAPTVSGKIFLAHLDRFILERGCHCIVPPVHEAEQRYSADDLDDLVFDPHMESAAGSVRHTVLATCGTASGGSFAGLRDAFAVYTKVLGFVPNSVLIMQRKPAMVKIPRK